MIGKMNVPIDKLEWVIASNITKGAIIKIINLPIPFASISKYFPEMNPINTKIYKGKILKSIEKKISIDI